MSANTTYVLVNGSGMTHTEVHATGCKAATRRVKGFPVEVSGEQTQQEIEEMQANPDEGFLKVHACAKPALRQWKASAGM